MRCNYHTHSTYCDGKSPLSDFVTEAQKTNYQQLGFSSHAPVPFENDFGIHQAEIPTYCSEIQQLQSNTDLKLLIGLECDYIPGMTRPFQYYKDTFHLDYIIGGVHLVKAAHDERIWFIDGSKREIYDNGRATIVHNNIQSAVTTFWGQSFEMIETQQFD